MLGCNSAGCILALYALYCHVYILLIFLHSITFLFIIIIIITTTTVIITL